MDHERLLIEYPMLAPLRKSHRELLDECAQLTACFETFKKEVAHLVGPLDEATSADEALALRNDLLAIACRHRIFSLALPKSLGGTGCTMLALSLGLEQLAQQCAGIANLLATHGLALAMVGACGNVEVLIDIARRIVDAEARGTAYLLSTAATEPSAGSDLEDDEQLARATLESQAEPVAGGYRLFGTKIYVSNGSLASAHVVVMPLSRKSPRETLSAFLVPAEAEGFAVVREERKLGQRASPAAELHFDGCFVPEAMRLSASTVSGRSLELVLGASRSIVGAFGAGIARGVYDTCRHRTTQPGAAATAQPIHPAHQTLLGRLWSNAREARSSYVEANLVNAHEGLISFSESELLRLLDRMAPPKLAAALPLQKLVKWTPLNSQTRKRLESLESDAVSRASSYGSATKVRTSELALENCRLAFELLGASATREDTGLPKYWRDARLLSIYEGTNDICLIDVYKQRQRLERRSTR